VGSVTGIGGLMAGAVSTVTAELTGRMLNQNPSYYLPIFIAAGCLYPAGLAVIHALSPRMAPVTGDELHARHLAASRTPLPEVG
jgi:hypothetical protein